MFIINIMNISNQKCSKFNILDVQEAIFAKKFKYIKKGNFSIPLDIDNPHYKTCCKSVREKYR